MPIPVSLQLIFPDVSLKSSQRLFLCTECHVCIYLMETSASGTQELRWLCSPHGSHFTMSSAKQCQQEGAAKDFWGEIRLILLEQGNLIFKRVVDISPHQPADSQQGGSSGTQNCGLWPGPGLAPSWQHWQRLSWGRSWLLRSAPSWQLICYYFKYPLFVLGTARNLVNWEGDI